MDDYSDLDEGLNISNLSDQVYHHVKRLIMTSKLKSGQRISEQRIAEKLAVSRTPIREALRRLEEDGLVVIEPRRHTTVATITLEDKRHIGQIRIQLDSLSVRLLAERATPEDCRKLSETARKCKDFAEKGDFASCFEMDSLFHCQMAELSGNPYLADLTKRIDHKVQLLRNLEETSFDKVNNGIALHLPIIEAIGQHDVRAAEQLLRDHLAHYYAPGVGQSA